MRPRNKKRHLLRGVIDRLVPAEYLEADYDTRRRARLTINFTFALVCFGPFYAFLYWQKYDLPNIAAFMMVVTVSCLVGVPAIFHRTKSMAYAVNYLLTCYFGVLNILIFIPGEFIRIQYLG